MGRRWQPPGRAARRALLGLLLLGLASSRVGSQASQPAPDAGVCRWPHNSTRPAAPAQQQGSCAAEPPLAPASAEDDQRWEYSSEPVADRFIVRFRSYAMAAEHHAALTEGLPEAAGWRLIERQNAAARFPTDFALLEVEPGRADAVKGALEGLAGVKDVHPEHRVTRTLAWAGSEECDTHSGSLCDVGPRPHIAKRPGRLTTKPSQGLQEEGQQPGGKAGRRQLRAEQPTVTSMFKAEELWAQGFHGELVKMGVFDTGIRPDHPHVKNIRERTNWTHEPTLEDGLGHGTFVAGVIGGTDANCPGFAPEVELYTFRVFTNDQVSYTSWFLDAFNYAIGTEMNVVNLSIGGPDYLDLPFVEKVWEITSSGILMVSAIGNDGPLYGTLNNPADQNDVIGVGGIDYSDKIASFSSRGMSTWELPRGYGRAKPDVVAYGRDVMGSRIQGGCRSLSGTSVASPVVAGAVCLLASTVPADKRWHFSGGILNPASMKQALVEGADPISGISMYEQGQGKLNLQKSKAILQEYVPRASVVPAKLDFTQCPFLWPFCRQPLYARAMPLMFNATVLNGMGLTGRFEGEPRFEPADEGGRLLDVRFEHSAQLWPWSGFLALYVFVKPAGAGFNGTASGTVSFTIVSPPMPGEAEPRTSTVQLPLTVAVIPTPPREKRVLWDQFHSLRYPPAYLPRDSLDVRNDILDWHGDHPHTNFHDMFDNLVEAGYHLEVLGSPLTCFDATQYGTLLLVDLEEEFFPEEAAKLKTDVERHGLGVIVFADWYNVDTMVKMRFFDDNTRSWWSPVTGGANVPALNDLLRSFGIAFGDALLEGQWAVGEEKIYFASGVNLARFPAGGTLHAAPLSDKATAGVARSSGHFGGGAAAAKHAVLGLSTHGAGRIASYGDSNCLDSSHARSACFQLLQALIQFAAEGRRPPQLFREELLLSGELGSADMALPQRRADVDLAPFSAVLQGQLRCHPNAPLDFEPAPLPRRGASRSRPETALTKPEDLPLNASAALDTAAVTTGQTQAGAVAGSLPEAASAAQQSPSPGLQRFLPVGEAGGKQQAQPGNATSQPSNEASEEDAALFLGKGGSPPPPPPPPPLPEAGQAAAAATDAAKPDDTAAATTAAAAAAAGTEEKAAAAATEAKAAAMEAKAAATEAKAAAEQAQATASPPPPAATAANAAAAAPEEAGGKAAGKAEPILTSIDPMESDKGKEATRQQFLEQPGAGGAAQPLQQLGGGGEGVRPLGKQSGLGGEEGTPLWGRLAGTLSAFPQVLAVVGVVGVFVMWHVRQRRRAAQENAPLRERGPSTRVLTLGMLGAGADTTSMKSRQRAANLERTPTLGR